MTSDKFSNLLKINFNYSCCAAMGWVQAICCQDSWQQCSLGTTWALNSQLLEPKTVIYCAELIDKWCYNSGFTNWVSHSLLCRRIWNHCKKFSYQDKNLKIHILQHGDVGNLFYSFYLFIHMRAEFKMFSKIHFFR